MAANGKYMKKYDKLILKLMSEGYSQTASAGIIGVTSKTISDWCTRYESFGEAVTLGRASRQAFWEKMGIEGATGKIKGFNATVWAKVSASEFNMVERREISLEADIKQDVTVTFVTADNSDDDSE